MSASMPDERVVLLIKGFPADLRKRLHLHAIKGNSTLRDLVIRILEESTRKEGRAK